MTIKKAATISESETPPTVIPVQATPTGMDSGLNSEDATQLPPGQTTGTEGTPTTIGSTSTTTNTTLADA
jgi:hypothetical protein